LDTLVFLTIRESENTANAIHIKANARNCGVVNSSPNTNKPSSNMIVGAIYCRKPTRVNDIRFAPVANNSSGIAVTIPAPISSMIIDASLSHSGIPLGLKKKRNTSANGVMIKVSTVNPVHGPTDTFFLMSP